MDSSPPISSADSPEVPPLSTLEALAALPGDGIIKPGSVVADDATSRPLPVGANIRPYLISDQTNPMDAQRPAAGNVEDVPEAARAILQRHQKIVAAFKGSELNVAEDPQYRKIVMDALATMAASYVLSAAKPADEAPAPKPLSGILGSSLAAHAAVAAGLKLDDDLAGEPP
jgi:hypothetical protein